MKLQQKIVVIEEEDIETKCEDQCFVDLAENDSDSDLEETKGERWDYIFRILRL